MTILEEILSRKEFKDDPPVLLDIGCSGKLVEKWKEIAKYSICIAFDADKREIEYVTKENGNYKKLYLFNCIVSDKANKTQDFYLTKSPFCSSALEPDLKPLINYTFLDHSFIDLFTVEKKIKLKAKQIKNVLKEINIDKIDWFKTDSQGMDLRLFNALGESVIRKIMIADFEPGIIDAYKKEDKLWNLLAYMEKKPFWVNYLHPRNAHRFNRGIVSGLVGSNRMKELVLGSSQTSVYGEISYINSFNDDKLFDKRDYLLMCILSLINKQYGFALEVAVKGDLRFKDPIFKRLQKHLIILMELSTENIHKEEIFEKYHRKLSFIFEMTYRFRLLKSRLKKLLRRILINK